MVPPLWVDPLPHSAAWAGLLLHLLLLLLRLLEVPSQAEWKEEGEQIRRRRWNPAADAAAARRTEKAAGAAPQQGVARQRIRAQ